MLETETTTTAPVSYLEMTVLAELFEPHRIPGTNYQYNIETEAGDTRLVTIDSRQITADAATLQYILATLNQALPPEATYRHLSYLKFPKHILELLSQRNPTKPFEKISIYTFGGLVHRLISSEGLHFFKSIPGITDADITEILDLAIQHGVSPHVINSAFKPYLANTDLVN